MIRYPHVNIANKYAREVVSGKRDVCLYVQQACQRHLDNLADSKKPDYPYKFDRAKGESVCKFAEMMPHVKGKWAGSLLVLEPWQCFIFAVLFGWVRKSDNLRRFREFYGEIPRKNGKALALDTPVPTISGFKKIKDVSVGDQVFGIDGKPCNVIAESEIFIDHNCYEVIFSTGEKVIADAGHQWVTTARVNAAIGEKRRFRRRKPPKLYLNKQGYWAGCGFWHEKCFTYKDEWRARAEFKKRSSIDLSKTPIGVDTLTHIRTTDELFKTQRYGARNDTNHSIEISKPVEYHQKKYILHPFVLGYWLGDGSKNCAQVTISYDDAFESVNNLKACGEIVKENKTSNEGSGGFAVTPIRSWNGEKRDKSGTSRLKKIGVLRNKHIPPEYLQGSVVQRLELLQGLMDSDGTICKNNGMCSFCNTNKQLIDDVFTLVASLGLKPNLREYEAKLYGKNYGAAYDVSFMAHDSFPVFKLKRKLSLQKKTPVVSPRCLTRQIVSIKKIKSVPVKCISVDSKDNLFLITKSYIPTHNSIIGSIIGNYMFAPDGEPGAEIFSGATTEKQAHEVFRPAWLMTQKTGGYRKRFDIELGGTEKNPGNIYSMTSASRFEAVVGKPGDGASVHCGIVDEYHEHRDDSLYDCFSTGMGARTQPLMVVVTTAGTNTSCPCYSKRKQIIDILSGQKQNDEIFGIIFSIDPDDDFTDFKVWKKANPNYNVSVFSDFLKKQHKSCLQESRKQNILKCKHLNLWSNAGASWLNMVEWEKAANIELDIHDFWGDSCYIGLDLASKIDVASLMPLFVRNGHYYLFSNHYIPESRTKGEDMAHYAGWAHDEYLTATPGNRIDFDYIKEDIRELAKNHDLSGEENGGGEVCNDPWNAQQFVTELLSENIAVVEVSQTVNMLSEPMKEIEAALKDGKFHHDGNPVTTWMFGNVMCKVDKKDNVFPFKEGEENKIDGAVATITAMSRAINQKIQIEIPVPEFF